LVEQFKAAVVDVVGFPFDARDLQAEFVERRGVLRNVGQQCDGALCEFRTVDDRVRQLPHIRLEIRHLKQHDGLRRRLTLIDGIVHGGDQALNVGPVKRRDERRAQP
jgi:hypothetical protein